jgi:hypothetical protein
VLICLHVWTTTPFWEVVGVQPARRVSAVAVSGQVGVAGTWSGAECVVDCWVVARVEIIAKLAHLGVAVCLARGNVYGQRTEDMYTE